MRRSLMGGVDISLPNVSYCEDIKDVHYTPYNLVRFYVGNITWQEKTVKIYTDSSTFEAVRVSEGNKWYSYVLPKDKGLYKIEGDLVKKVVVKADIDDGSQGIIPNPVVEASFKGSDTSNVTDMSNMFVNSLNLTSLDVSSFDTSNVTNMGNIFLNCYSLTSLDVSNFDTSKVTNMGNIFLNCWSLTSLDVSNFDTSKVTNMSSMFSNCSGLTSLDVSNFNTSNVTDMSCMFNRCGKLTSLDLRNFNISKVTDMSLMFSECSGLTLLDISGWNTSKVTDMSLMFNGCTSLTTIRMVGCLEATINKIRGVKPSTATIVTE